MSPEGDSVMALHKSAESRTESTSWVCLGSNLQLNEQLALSNFSGENICPKFDNRESLEQKYGFQWLCSLQRILQ